MRAILILVILFIVNLSAEMLRIGDIFPNYTIKNQFAKEIQYNDKIGLIVVSYDRNSTALFNEMVKKLDIKAPYNFIIDVSGAPKAVIELFIKPGMQEYQKDILMSEDKEFNLKLPYKDDASLAFIYLDSGKIEDIKYASEQKEIDELVSQYMAN